MVRGGALDASHTQVGISCKHARFAENTYIRFDVMVWSISNTFDNVASLDIAIMQHGSVYVCMWPVCRAQTLPATTASASVTVCDVNNCVAGWLTLSKHENAWL